MPPWCRCAKLGIAIYNLNSGKDGHLAFNVGDSLHIVEESGDWFRGFNVKERKVIGLIPGTYVRIKDSFLTRIGNYETIAPKELPIVQEMTAVLLEWGGVLKSMFTLCSSAESKQQFSDIRKMMLDVIDWRKHAMSRKLTAEELKELQLKATAKIDLGNLMLGLDLIVRDDQGNVLNPDRTGTIALFRRHRHTLRKLEKEKQAEQVIEPKASQRHTLSFLVYVKNFVCKVGDDADVIMTLYDAKRSAFFTENYVIKWGHRGLPKDLELLNNLRVQFTDLGSKDLKPHRDSVYLICQVVRLGAMFPSVEQDSMMGVVQQTNVSKRSVKAKLRRPFGVAALDVTAILNGTDDSDETKQYFIPFLSCGKSDFLEDVIKEAILKSDDVSVKSHKGQGLWASLKLIDSMYSEHSVVSLSSPAVARKMGFPEVIMPADVRNDFYIALMSGDFTNVNGKLQAGNIEVVMQVCNREGKVLPNVVSLGCGIGEMTDEYRSVVYYHSDSPRWFETFKVAVPIEEFYGCHLRFTFRHRSTNDEKDRAEKDFALAYVPFIGKNGTTISDGSHRLMVYRIDHKKPADPLAYLSLLSSEEEHDIERTNVRASVLGGLPSSAPATSKGPFSWSGKERFVINTLVCSTKLTHNADLLGLLNWKEKPELLKVHLQNLMKVDGEEVVKFLQDTLDALFNILMQDFDTNINELVFEALIFIVSLIADRKFQQFRSVLDSYINRNFSATLAYTKLLDVFKLYVDNGADKKYAESLFKALKYIEYVMKFIVRSRKLFAALNDGHAKVPFEMLLQQLFVSINGLMVYNDKEMIKTQGAVLKYAPSVVSDVVTVFDAVGLTKLFVQLVDAVPAGRLQRQKLEFLYDLTESDLFANAESRQLLVTLVVKHVQLEMKPDSKELELCARIVQTVVQRLAEAANPRASGSSYFTVVDESPDIAAVAAADADMSVVVLQLLRPVIECVINMDRSSALAQDYVAILVAILRQMNDSHYAAFIMLINRSDLLYLLVEILMVFNDLISKCVFPSDWNEMVLLQNSVLLKTLRFLSRTIREHFSKSFDSQASQLWSHFFLTAIRFLTQDALQLEMFSVMKRHKIISRYQDMRREMGFEIRSMWFNLGASKIRFIPALVGPILEMTLIPEKELRKATIPIFFDMMQCEFMQIIPGSRANQMASSFHQFENEMITRLDILVEGGKGDESYRELFYSIMHEKCANHQTMREQGLMFVEIVQKLLLRLLEYRTIIHDECKENRMNCIVNLLNFYHDIDRQEMYIRYLNKLCELHLQCDNFTEAAHTLLLYTKLLRWTDDPLESNLVSVRYPRAQTHRELKCHLYNDCIEYFDKGKMWEKGIEICEELVAQYKHEVFDYARLSQLLKRQAGLYEKILRDLRATPMYFRVCYYGRGFPSFLQNKSFVFRGKDYEHLSDFTARLLNQFPRATVLNSLNQPSEELMMSDAQYLQINAVNPLFEPKKLFIGKSVSEQILRYWKSNEISRFVFSRPLEGQNDVTHLWLERTILTIAYPLPGILQWFEVSSLHTFRVSPLESAVESISGINERLQALIEEHRAAAAEGSDSSGPKLPLNPLSMQLSGVVDPAVNGGISLYKSFFTGEYLNSPAACVDPALGSTGHHHKTLRKADMELVYKLKDVTTHQLVLLNEGLAIHGARCPDNLRPFHEHMVQQFEKMLELTEKEYGIKPPLASVKAKGKPSLSSMVPDVRSNSMFFLPSSTEIATADPRKPPAGTSAGQQRVSTAVQQGTLLRNNAGKTSKSSGSGSRIPSIVSTDSSTDSGSGGSSVAAIGPLTVTTVLGARTASDSTSIVELTQTLTPARPRRPDHGKSRPNSGNLKSRLGSLPSLSPSSLSGGSAAGEGFISYLPSPPGSMGSGLVFSDVVQPQPPPKRGPVSTMWQDHADMARQVSGGALSSDSCYYEGDIGPPPPVPEKRAYADYGNTDDERHHASILFSSPIRQNSHKNKPPPPLPPIDSVAGEDSPPPPVPEKRSSGYGGAAFFGSSGEHSTASREHAK